MEVTEIEDELARQELSEQIAGLAALTVGHLIPDYLNNQPEQIHHIELLLMLFKQLGNVRLDILPKVYIDELKGHINGANALISKIRDASVKRKTSGPGWFELIKDIRNSYGTYFRELAPIISFSSLTSAGREQLEKETVKVFDDLQLQAKNQAKGFEGKLAEELLKVSNLRNEIEQTVEKAKQAAEEVGVVQHAIHFKQEADDHKSAANRWLWVTSLLGLLTLALAIGSIVLYFSNLPSWSTSQSIQLAVSKVIIFSVLFYGLVGSARIYRSHRHNYVVNKHRQNALSTFEAFAKAARDEQTKSAVLLQTTQCIFSPQHSGYISQDSDAGNYSSVLEVIRGIAAPQSK